jgi:hypothetical protein
MAIMAITTNNSMSVKPFLVIAAPQKDDGDFRPEEIGNSGSSDSNESRRQKQMKSRL